MKDLAANLGLPPLGRVYSGAVIEGGAGAARLDPTLVRESWRVARTRTTTRRSSTGTSATVRQ